MKITLQVTVPNYQFEQQDQHNINQKQKSKDS